MPMIILPPMLWPNLISGKMMSVMIVMMMVMMMVLMLMIAKDVNINVEKRKRKLDMVEMILSRWLPTDLGESTIYGKCNFARLKLSKLDLFTSKGVLFVKTSNNL